ncbi:phage tail protein [Pseudomonas viridiflava]|uniref:phage tail protein n=1 Tax=Pseudomonas viridiflava TaxID=33069 RepID=UPI0015E3C877|nr:phage tail protein [Pseudomonas viridiflava]MBA1229257.1 phage tail protein [Pseudomonas viridiflava]
MAASITLAGEKLIAQKQAANMPLNVVRFVLANVPGLNVNGPVNRAGLKPPAAQIVHTASVTQQGFVNPNQVVYSLLMGTDIGDFDWNWIGMETSDDVLLSVAYVPVQQKRKNVLPDQIGNNVTRNFLVVFDGAQQLTGIKIDASTWQFDYTARMKGIDERERRSNRDIYGRASFFGSGLQLQQTGNTYRLAPGVAYVDGVRLELLNSLSVVVPSVPTRAWLDVALQRELNDVVATFTVVFGLDPRPDYSDSASTRHFVEPIADITGSTTIVDLRSVEPINAALVKHFAARTGDYPQLRARATTKEDVGLGNLPNAISDDVNSNNGSVLATTRMVAGIRSALNQVVAAIVDGTTSVGRAARLTTARTLRFKGAATGSGTYDGSADTEIALTLADTGVPAGSYTKVTVNSKGLAVAGSNPNSLGGYGITNAYTKEETYATFVKQGGGIGQLPSRLNIGWSSTGLRLTVEGEDLGRIWTETAFNPNNKADRAITLAGYGIGDAYTSAQVNNLLNQRVMGDMLTTAGFASGNLDWPYFMSTNNTVISLQRRLGFTPVQQGGGANQSNSQLILGWGSGGAGIRAQVDATDIGLLWGERNFNRPDVNNFLAVQGLGDSVQLPAGGTWCYALMHYGPNGNGITGRSGQAPGGTLIQFSGGTTTYGFAWRYVA